MNHSKAPWHLAKYKSAVISADQNLVATAIYNEDDARIIAAAPDLLEACIQLLRHAEIMINANHPDWIAAHDAIIKATGGKPEPFNPFISNRGF